MHSVGNGEPINLPIKMIMLLLSETIYAQLYIYIKRLLPRGKDYVFIHICMLIASGLG